MFKHALFALLIVMTATASIAHAQQKKGANGGMVAISQGHPIEFMVKGQDLVFYTGTSHGPGWRQDDYRATRARCSEYDGREVAGSAWLKSARRVLGESAWACAHRAICYGMRALLLNVRCRAE